MEAFPEHSSLLKVLELSQGFARTEVLGTATLNGLEFPIYSLVIGSEDRRAPTIGLFGGVHGLERIGSQCVLAYLESLFEQLKWDFEMRERLKNGRIISIPIVNPAGMYFGRRSNPNGVDLMRNSPTEAEKSPPLLLGGHRLGPLLPWYRGKKGAPMELESQLVVDFVKRETFESEATILLDVHSGFGYRDRLWYPYAKSTGKFPAIDQVKAMARVLNRSYPNHVYLVEPQALSYTTHGDLWDYLFDMHYEQFGGKKLYLPWTLEMGSWIWVKKNPFQIFAGAGMFNPVKEHRYKRTLRRHMALFDFLLRAAKNHQTWTTAPGERNVK